MRARNCFSLGKGGEGAGGSIFFIFIFGKFIMINKFDFSIKKGGGGSVKTRFPSRSAHCRVRTEHNSINLLITRKLKTLLLREQIS